MGGLIFLRRQFLTSGLNLNHSLDLNHELLYLRHYILNVPDRAHKDHQPTLRTHLEEGNFEVREANYEVLVWTEEVIIYFRGMIDELYEGKEVFEGFYGEGVWDVINEWDAV